MPYLRIETNAEQLNEQTEQEAVMSELTDLLSSLLGKSRDYVQVFLQPGVPMMFGGSSDPTAFVELRSLGLDSGRCADLSASLCQWISSRLRVDPRRVYIAMSDWPREQWGWNGRTFG
jgi:phenylpyruvate tautomerase PptA (4-oxalocrotonate tautomerase family)